MSQMIMLFLHHSRFAKALNKKHVGTTLYILMIIKHMEPLHVYSTEKEQLFIYKPKSLIAMLFYMDLYTVEMSCL